MELEVGVRTTRAIGNLTFTSTETEAVFVLLAHLPGFKKDEIEISINEARTEIRISGGGQRESLEAVISRRLTIAREVENERFQEVFQIPSGVILERIDAGFDEEEAILIVLMPKLTRGEVSGTRIEEIEEEEEQEEGTVKGEEEISPDRDKKETLQPEELESEVSNLQTSEEDLEEKNKEPEPDLAEMEIKKPEKKIEEEMERPKSDPPQKPLEATDTLDPHRELHPAKTFDPKKEAEEIPTVEIPDRSPESLKQMETVESYPEPTDRHPEQEETAREQEKLAPETPDQAPETVHPTESQEPDLNLPRSEEQEAHEGENSTVETPDGDTETVQPTETQEPDQNLQQECENPIAETSDRTPETQESIEPPEKKPDLELTEERKEQERESPAERERGVESLEEIRGTELSKEEAETSREGSDLDSGKIGETGKAGVKRRRESGRGSPLLLCPSTVLAGSAFILSLVVLAFHFLRGRRRK